MTDLTLKAVLTGDAGPLNATLRQGATGVQQFSATVQNANQAQETSAKEATAAAQAQATAMQQAAVAARTATAGLNPALQAQQQAMRNARAEANNLRQAYRQLPAQMTDVVTSLASGMPAWLVLVQQGGQIKDSFGGAIPAVKALASAFTPLRVAAGAALGTVGALILAYNQGAAEVDAYSRAIIFSGNAAGVTTGQLDAMARSIDGVVGTQRAAAAAVAAVAAGGRVSAQNIQLVATTAIRLERTIGQTVAETVEQFEALGKSPVEAAARLNDRYRFLTTAVYDQVKALQDQGRASEAAALAQQTFAAAMSERAVEVEARLGSIERGWQSVKDVAAEAWDAMLGVGRQDTLEEELAEVGERLAQAAENRARFGVNTYGEGADRQRQAELQELLRLQRRSADAQRDQAAAAAEHIAKVKEREAAEKASADAYRNVNDGIQQRLTLARAELSSGGQLTESQRVLLEVKRQIAEADGKIGGAAAARLLADARALGMTLDQLASLRELQKANEASVAAENARMAAATRRAESEEQANAAMWRQVQAIGLTRDELYALEQQRVATAIETLESALATKQAAFESDEETNAIRRQIDALRERQGLLANRNIRQTLADSDDEAQRRVQREAQENLRREEALASSISEGILKGAREGASIMDVFERELEAQFSRIVLQPVIEPFVRATNRAIEQLLQMGLNYFAGSGGSNVSAEFNTGLPAPGFSRPGEGFHGGGVVGQDTPSFRRSLPASAWAGAPRFHKGMLASDEYTAILQEGESVLTPGQLRQVARMGGASQAAPQVTIINQTGQAVTGKAQRGSDGGLEVVLQAAEEFMADRVSSGQGALWRSIEQRTGSRSSFNS
jgi:phage-related minor tail protein